MRIGEFSQATGLPVRTIRYYEKIGLLPEPDRSGSGYRIFGQRHVQRARFIRRARGLGFKLEQIREILDTASLDGPNCRSVRAVVHRNIEAIDQRIADLSAMRDLLGQTLNDFDSPAEPTDHDSICPVIESRDRHAAPITLDSPVEWKV